MIEIFETCQTKPIAKQTNMDESLIIRSIVPLYFLGMKTNMFLGGNFQGMKWYSVPWKYIRVINRITNVSPLTFRCE